MKLDPALRSVGAMETKTLNMLERMRLFVRHFPRMTHAISAPLARNSHWDVRPGMLNHTERDGFLRRESLYGF